MATQANTATRNGNGQTSTLPRVAWPQERWVGAIVLVALGLLILIRLGFRGVGVSLGATGKVSV